MPKITPADPKNCMEEYLQFIKTLKEPFSEENSACTSPEPFSNSNFTHDFEIPDMDEDSKMSAVTLSSVSSSEETLRRKACGKSNVLQPLSPGKNPRKSPRQHASTLAILSNLLYQRKRRSKNKIHEEQNFILPTIPEEISQPNTSFCEQDKQEQLFIMKVEEPTLNDIAKTKSKSPDKYHWRFKPKLNYRAIAQNIEDELDCVLDDVDKYSLEMENDIVDFHNSRTNTAEILRLFEDAKAKETDKSCRRFFNGTPGRKPGRKRKKNLTGWPNKNKKAPKREQSREKEEPLDKNSIADSTSLHDDSEIEEDLKHIESSIKPIESECKNSVSDSDCDIDRVNKSSKTLKEKTKKELLQPYVYVQKLDNKLINNRFCTPKRTLKRQKRMPGSPRSPRMLRKPRGKWYKER